MTHRPSDPVVLKGVYLHAQTRLLRHPDHQAAVAQKPVDLSVATVTQLSTSTAPAARERAQEEHLAKVSLELEQARTEGRRLGHEEGQALARQEAERAGAALKLQLDEEFAERDRVRTRQLSAGVAALKEAVDQQRQLLAKRLQMVERLGVDLAFEALCRLLGNQAHRRAHLEALVAHAAREAHLRAPAKIRLHPKDWQLLMESDPSSWLPFPMDLLELTQDEALEPGACLLETALHSLDISMGTQLEQLRKMWSAHVSAAPDHNRPAAGDVAEP